MRQPSQVNPYLHDHHFPAQQTAPDGLVAAFGTGPAPVDPLSASRWAIPRFVCGWAWRSPKAPGCIALPDSHPVMRAAPLARRPAGPLPRWPAGPSASGPPPWPTRYAAIIGHSRKKNRRWCVR